ncbi:MAG TPA: NfeD family protein [Thermoplasmata archaeon]|nr:NfeD family protein [Thermoplasmata archaeon]
MAFDPVLVYLLITIVFSILLITMGLLGGLGGVFDIHLDFGHGVDVGGVDVGGVGHDLATDQGQFAGAGISPLSLPILFVFGTFFGVFGTVMEVTKFLPTFGVPFAAGVLSAVLTAIVYYAMVNVFVKTQATSEYRLKDLIGSHGEITVPVEPGIRGQVLVVTEAAGRTLISAVSKESLRTGERVQVTGMEGSSLIVEKV